MSEGKDGSLVTHETPIEETWRKMGMSEEDIQKKLHEREAHSSEKKEAPEAPMPKAPRDTEFDVIDMDLAKAREMINDQIAKEDAGKTTHKSPAKKESASAKKGFWKRIFG